MAHRQENSVVEIVARLETRTAHQFLLMSGLCVRLMVINWSGSTLPKKMLTCKLIRRIVPVFDLRGELVG